MYNGRHYVMLLVCEAKTWRDSPHVIPMQNRVSAYQSKAESDKHCPGPHTVIELPLEMSHLHPLIGD